MGLSITQRLALTVAVLAGLVMVPVCGWAYVALTHGMETRALERAHSLALEIEHILWSQLDEDILFDFEGQRVTFDKLNIARSDWTLIRGDGRMEIAEGVFKDELVLLPCESLRKLHTLLHQHFAVATVPLTPDQALTWMDMPDVVRQTIQDRIPDAVFLWAKSDVLDQNNIFAVQMLDSQQIIDLSVTEQGECVEVLADPLVKSLPSGMDADLTQRYGIQEPQITGWHAYQGELIAQVEGHDPNGLMIRLGVNRFGQEYDLDETGTPVASRESSRLLVAAAFDITHEQARTLMLGRSIVMGGIGIWGLIILVAWLVTKRALRPVHDMVLQADRIMPSKLNERLPVGPVTDELSRVAHTVNHMLDRLQQGYLREQQFTGDVSHEMRNPLAKMIAEIDLAQSKERDVNEYRDILTRLKHYSQGMQKLVDSLLMLARLDSGLQALDIRPFDVTELMIETIKTFSKTFASRVHVDLGPSITPMMAIGHESLIGVLIGNLLDNALRYGPADSPVFLRIHRRAQTIHFTIEDQGPGIPEDQKVLVFNRFHRLEKSRSKATGGHGLGLAIVHAIAEIHHITIDMTSGPERGTVVSFSLPAQHD